MALESETTPDRGGFHFQHRAVPVFQQGITVAEVAGFPCRWNRQFNAGPGKGLGVMAADGHRRIGLRKTGVPQRKQDVIRIVVSPIGG
jgi:hypothetical protein